MYPNINWTVHVQRLNGITRMQLNGTNGMQLNGINRVQLKGLIHPRTLPHQA